jgi:hypothetical protein
MPDATIHQFPRVLKLEVDRARSPSCIALSAAQLDVPPPGYELLKFVSQLGVLNCLEPDGGFMPDRSVIDVYAALSWDRNLAAPQLDSLDHLDCAGDEPPIAEGPPICRALRAWVATRVRKTRAACVRFREQIPAVDSIGHATPRRDQRSVPAAPGRHCR